MAQDKIKHAGNVIVDLTVEKWTNRGQEVFRKVLLGNITNIDFYIGIEFIEGAEKLKILYSDNYISEEISYKIMQSLIEESSNIVRGNGSHLYLIKNMNSPGIYIVVPLKEDNEENINVLVKIIKELIEVN